MRARRDAIGLAARSSASNRVSKKLAKRSASRGIIAVYLATPRELSLAPFIERARRRGWRLAAPHKDGFVRLKDNGELQGEVHVADIALFLVPGIAFSRDGARLGQGGGWYDRVLVHRRADSLVVGVAFDEQIVDEIPCEAHDIPLDFLCTPRDFVCCKSLRPSVSRQSPEIDRTPEAHGR